MINKTCPKCGGHCDLQYQVYKENEWIQLNCESCGYIGNENTLDHVEYIEETQPSNNQYYEIEESEKYSGCYNIYNEHGMRVHYFIENDNKNLERAQQWVKEHTRFE